MRKNKKVLKLRDLITPINNKMSERLLSEYALKGWFPSDLKNRKDVIVLKRGEPEALDYSIVHNPNPKYISEKEFIDACTECGWDLVYSQNNIFIFKAQHGIAKPINTDEKIKLKTEIKFILKNYIKNLPNLLLPVSYMILNFILILNTQNNILDGPTIDAIISSVILFLLLIISILVTFIIRIILNKTNLERSEVISNIRYKLYKLRKLPLCALYILIFIMFVTLMKISLNTEFTGVTINDLVSNVSEAGEARQNQYDGVFYNSKYYCVSFDKNSRLEYMYAESCFEKTIEMEIEDEIRYYEKYYTATITKLYPEDLLPEKTNKYSDTDVIYRIDYTTEKSYALPESDGTYKVFTAYIFKSKNKMLLTEVNPNTAQADNELIKAVYDNTMAISKY